MDSFLDHCKPFLEEELREQALIDVVLFRCVQFAAGLIPAGGEFNVAAEYHHPLHR